MVPLLGNPCAHMLPKSQTRRRRRAMVPSGSSWLRSTPGSLSAAEAPTKAPGAARNSSDTVILSSSTRGSSALRRSRSSSFPHFWLKERSRRRSAGRALSGASCKLSAFGRRKFREALRDTNRRKVPTCGGSMLNQLRLRSNASSCGMASSPGSSINSLQLRSKETICESATPCLSGDASIDSSKFRRPQLHRHAVESSCDSTGDAALSCAASRKRPRRSIEGSATILTRVSTSSSARTTSA
mmetsp:Transcript_607/g.1320  ORF Transcript_607/g.1320 Transcript_607/m.1320 type:complete len:242 (+) Transcript_607:125-850(+)